MAADRSHAAEVSRAGWWLISAYPDAWYFEDPAHTYAVADELVRLRARVDAGMVAR